MDSREDHHWVVIFHSVDFVSQFAWVNVGDFLVHIEEVAVALAHDVDAETLDRLREVEEHGKTGVVDAIALVATLLGSAAGNVTWNEVTECRIAALQIVVAVFLGNIATLLGACLQCLGILQFLRYPDTTVVTQRL